MVWRSPTRAGRRSPAGFAEINTNKDAGVSLAEFIASARTPHGLRKAALRRLAEAGCTTKQIAAIGGHKTLTEVEHYTRDADQERLADEAFRKLKRRPARAKGERAV